MPVSPFEELSVAERRNVVGQRFKITPAMMELATPSSLITAWVTGDARYLLSTIGGQPLLPSNTQPSTVNIETLIKGLNGKVGMTVEQVETIATYMYKRLHLPQHVELILKTVTDGEVIPLTGKQHKVFPQVFRAVKRRDNVWLAGEAGTGKTFLVSQIADVLNLPFFRISCGPQTPASIVFGHTTASGGYAPGIAYQALNAEGAVLLFDEFDRMNPAVAVMCNGLLDGNKVTFPNGETLGPKPNTIYVVAANTYGRPSAEFGTAQRQDTSTMSRFVKIAVEVDEQLEREVFGNNDWVLYVQRVRKAVKALGVTSLCVSPRASEYGVRMLADGEQRSDVEDMLLWNGTPKEDVIKIKAQLHG